MVTNVNYHLFTFVSQLFDMENIDLKREYQNCQESTLFGRYIHLDHIKSILEKHAARFKVSVLGQSVLNEDIYFVELGNGNKKILMWSQMHGNESTTTKAAFDLMNLLSKSENAAIKEVLTECTIGIIPMLNPDGSRAYDRLNANEVDLNRDAQDLSQPESRILRKCFDDFQPDFCFNLHGQRTIFSAGGGPSPASVSFLSPAQDVDRTVTHTRKRAMKVIVAMDHVLQKQIPGQVGVYDDSFNINCVGDTFQSMNVPTILFEAGHCHNDYDREKVRELIFQSLWVGVNSIAYGNVQGIDDNLYFEIPQNDKLFYDIIIRSARVEKGDGHEVLDVAIQYEERLEEGRVVFIPKIAKISNLNGFYGHREIDAHGRTMSLNHFRELKAGVSIDFVLLDGQKLSLSV